MNAYKPGGPGNKQTWLSKWIAYTAAGLNEPSLVAKVQPRAIAAGTDAHLTNYLLRRFALLAASGIAPADVLTVMEGRLPTSAVAVVSNPYAEGVTSLPMPGSLSAMAASSSSSSSSSTTTSASSPGSQTPPRVSQLPTMPPSSSSASSSSSALEASPRSLHVHNTDEENKNGVVMLGSAQSAAAALVQPLSSGFGASSLVSPTSSAAGTFGVGKGMAAGGLARVTTARRAPPKAAPVGAAATLALDAGGSVGEGKGRTIGLIREDEKVVEEEEEGDDDNDEHGLRAGSGSLDREARASALDRAAGGDGGQLVRHIQNSMQQEAQGGADGGGLKLGRVQTGRKQGTVYSTRQLTDLRTAVQKLCASVNPIGKCIEFVHNDIDDMDKELSQWKKQAEQATAQLQVERKATETALAALNELVADAQRELEEQRLKVCRAKAQVLANEAEIAKLLEQSSSFAS